MKVFGLLLVFAVANAQKTTVETLAGDARFSTLVSLVTSAGLVDTFNNGDYTIFAPTNTAFAAVPATTLATLQNNVTLLTDVLLYHVAAGKVPSSAAGNELPLTMANGKDARINVYTHNNKVTIQGSVISQFDIMASNGIIHVIDSVMMAPSVDIVGYVSGNPELSTLLGLVVDAGLATALQKDGLTLFAPTNAAFDRLSAQELTDISTDPLKLAAVLTYHVVNSTQYSVGLYQKESLPTLNTNDNLVIHMVHHQADVKVENALVMPANIGVTNGVVHIVDHVLVPHQDPVIG